MTDDQRAIHPTLAVIIPLVAGLAEVLGDDAEVVLHELSHPHDSVIAIAGNVTGRRVGAPLTDLILRLLRQGKLESNLLNYESRGPDGKLLRSSTILIRDDAGQLIGCLCINFDLTKWTVAKYAIDSYCRTTPLAGDVAETFTHDIESMLLSNIEEVIRMQETPVTLMKKADKLAVVSELDQRGVFLVKGAVTRVASMLDVSRYTVYNYLEEIRHQGS